MQPAPATEQATDQLTERKTSEIKRTQGYQVVGYVMQNPRGDYCLSAQGAVRWLSSAEHWRLMHEQDGKLFSTQAERVQSSGSIEAEFAAWKAYPLPPRNAEGRFDADWLHREFVAFKAGMARRATASKAEATAVACNAALRAAPAMPVDADARDAARYRWLRDSARSVDWSRRYVAPKATSAYRTFCRNHPQQMDDDIDVAIAANTKQGTP